MGVDIDHNIQYSFLEFAVFVLELVRRGSACRSIYYGLV